MKGNYRLMNTHSNSIKRTIPIACGLLLLLTGQAYATMPVFLGPVFAAYDGSQQGVTVRDLALNQSFSFDTGFNISGIAAGPSNNVFLTSGNHIYDYASNGSQLNDMAFPDPGVNYTDVAYNGTGVVFASYDGSQQGVTVRDLNLNQNSFFSTGFNINGIAAGPNNDVFLASGNHLYDFAANGTQLNDMTFPDTGINYTDVAYNGSGTIFASYDGSQQGVTVRDLNLNQSFSFNTGFNISGIAAGRNNDVYLTSGNHIYDYSATGNLITDMTFPDAGINYTDVSVAAPVPEPSDLLLMLSGIGLVGFSVARRKTSSSQQ
jgi:hypothetical protein